MQYLIEKPWIHITIDETFHNKTIETFLDVYKQSKKNKYLLFQQKQILLNNKIPTIQTVLHKNDILSLFIFQNVSSNLPIDKNPIDIVYEDDFLLLVNKPPHIIIHSDGSEQTTLCDRVQYYLQQTNQDCLVHPIHRLDKETSGVVIFCKCGFFQPYFDDLLMQKKIHREYVAIAQGHIPLNQKVVVNQPIGRDRHDAKKQRISSSGKEAYTSFYCKRHIGNHSLVYCTLKTGRTHQIRVHLAFLKHPILSDTLYGKKDSLISRLALHAYKVTFLHPLTYKEIQIETAIPMDFAKVINK